MTFIILSSVCSCKEEFETPPPPDTTVIEGTWLTHSLVVSTPDLLGSWQIHFLTDGTQDNFISWSGWAHALLTFDNNGKGQFSSVATSPEANTSHDSVLVSFTSDGVLIDSANNTYHGILSSDKRMIVATMTNNDGGFTMAIGQKIIPGTSYIPEDLVGTWHMHSLVTSNNSFAGWATWIHGILSIDESGSGIFSDIVESSGNNTLNNPGTFSISSNGVVSIPGNATFYGYLSSDKSTLVATITDDRGGYNLTILQKDN